MGVCNPAGESAGYNGLYFTDSELRELASEGRMLHVPVKAEHRGEQLGTVVSSFVDAAGRLNCEGKRCFGRLPEPSKKQDMDRFSV